MESVFPSLFLLDLLMVATLIGSQGGADSVHSITKLREVKYMMSKSESEYRDKLRSIVTGSILFDVVKVMSGSIIEPEDYMQEFDAINYPGLLSLAQIQSCITTTTSNKL